MLEAGHKGCVMKGDREILKTDTDDGYTQIANLLLEALAIAPLSGVEKGAVLALWRITYGWENGVKRHTDAEVSISGWSRMLNTNPVYAARIIQRLVQNNVITSKDLGQGKGYVFSMNTRVNEWVEGKLNSLGLSERFKLPYTNKYKVPPAKRFTPLATNLLTLKESIKESIKEKNYIDNKNNNFTKKPHQEGKQRVTGDDMTQANAESISGQSIEKAIRIARGEVMGMPEKRIKFLQAELDRRKIPWQKKKKKAKKV